ncbi:unnamed protein product [Chironomus riparius]|uniref:Uncharacterized protein n=1 Tax=Chironomus riparius TaxID=315576 RepID=A0A9N9RXB7_9DIPT|nr:unnamed protein product [Chironomus riparius]
MLQKKHIVIVMLVFYLYSVNCENEKLFIECDPTKESGEKASSDCPKNAKCVELGTNKDNISTKGLCACIFNFTVNKNYSSIDKNSRYCVESANHTNNSKESVTSTAKSLIPTLQPTTVQTIIVPLKTSSTTLAPAPKPEPTKKVEATTPKSSVESQTKASSDNNNNNDKEHDKKQQITEEIKPVSPETHHILGGIIIPIMIVFAFIGVVYGIRKYDVLERAQNSIRNRRSGGQTHQTRYDGLENDFDDDPLLI